MDDTMRCETITRSVKEEAVQITGIHIEHFLSFEAFTWGDPDPQLNVIVGPNNAGKTNFFRALLAVRDALLFRAGSSSEWPRERWIGAAHQPSEQPSFAITVQLSLTSAAEQELLCALIAAAFSDSQTLSSVSGPLPLDVYTAFARAADAHLTPQALAWLFQGRLRVQCYGEYDWSSTYEVDVEGKTLQIALEDAPNHSSRSLADAWWRRPEGERLKKRMTAVDTLSKVPMSAKVREDTVKQLEQQGIPLQPQHLNQYLPQGAQDWLVTAQGRPIKLQVSPSDRDQIRESPPLRRLEKLLGYSLETSRTYSARDIFAVLLQRALVCTEAFRGVPESLTFQGAAAPAQLTTYQELPSYLFWKKNGKRADVEEYQEIKETFQTLLGSALDFDVSGEPHEKSARVDVWIRQGTVDVPLREAGQGLTEALFLSAVLSSREGQILLLDEPALNLHPGVQGALLQLLRQRTTAGGDIQCFLITHSPALIHVDRLWQTSRFVHDGHQTTRVSLSSLASESDNDRLVRLMLTDPAVSALFFASAALLVEGATEAAALPIWFTKRHNDNDSLAQRNIAVIDVHGADSFGRYLRLVQLLKLPWAIVCDGHAYKDTGNQGIVPQLKRLSIAIPSIAEPSFEQLRTALETVGVFTTATSEKDCFETLVEQQAVEQQLTSDPDWDWVRSHKDKELPGWWVADKTTSCPEEVKALFAKVLEHLEKTAMHEAMNRTS